MDEKERERDNLRIDAQKVKVERGKMAFLQKYYHKVTQINYLGCILYG